LTSTGGLTSKPPTHSILIHFVNTNRNWEITLKVLFISSEVSPFSRTGAAGDFTNSFCKALKSLGHEVRIVTPRYSTIRERRFGLRDVSRLTALKIRVGEREIACSVKSGFLVGSKVQVYFLDCPGIFPRPRPEQDCRNGAEKGDIHRGFALLNHAALQLMTLLNWYPEVIHCNGWQTALTPYLLKRRADYRECYSKAFIVVQPFSLSNHTLFNPSKAEDMGILPEEVNIDGLLDCEGGVSFLKAGLTLADKVITINSKLLEEANLQIPCESYLMELLKNRRDTLHYFKAGVDLDEWDPSTDPKIAHQYQSENLEEGKAGNRATLRRRYKLEEAPDVPIVGMISRLIDQTTLEKINQNSAQTFTAPMKFLVSGIKDPEREALLRRWSESYQKQMTVVFTGSEAVERQIIAGSDIFVLPVYNEASRRYLAYVMKYGTIPIICDHHEMLEMISESGFPDGYPFAFPSGRITGFTKVLKQVEKIFLRKPAWLDLCRRMMEPDFSWEATAARYVELFTPKGD